MELYSLQDIVNEPHIATIGFFDGVHSGHRFLLNQLRQEAEKLHLKTLVITFENSPRQYFSHNKVERNLTIPSEKLVLLEQFGIDDCLMLRFDERIAKKTAFEFMQLLQSRFGVERMLLGYDHHFGSDGLNTIEQYREKASLLGIKIDSWMPLKDNDLIVSSSEIRRCLDSGEICKANLLLGYSYELTGKVVSGHQIGRQLGFPTANLKVDPIKHLPKNGIYEVRVQHGEHIYKGVMSIGVRPTLHGKNKTVEVYILNFDGNLYGEILIVSILRFMRDELYFSSLDDLKEQISKDVDDIK